MDYQELNDLVEDFLNGSASTTYGNVASAITNAHECGDITDTEAANLISLLEGI